MHIHLMHYLVRDHLRTSSPLFNGYEPSFNYLFGFRKKIYILLH